MGLNRGKNVVGTCRKRMSNFPCYKPIVQKSTQKQKDMENCRFKLLPLRTQLRLFFRIIFSANQLSLYGAVAEICEEYESFHERTKRLVVIGQSSSSIALSVIKKEVLLDSDDATYQRFFIAAIWRTN